MTEDELLRNLTLADPLRIAAVDLAVTEAPRVLVESVWQAVQKLATGTTRPGNDTLGSL